MPKVTTAVDVERVVERLESRTPTDDVDERILDAAGALLLRHGLDGLEVDRVAEDSGVARSTIYRRFDGRNALIAATVAHEARRFLAALADTVDADAPLEDQVVTAFATGLGVARATGLDARLREEPLLLRLLTVDAGPIVAAAREQLGGTAVAELLVRLAISFVLTPETVVDEATLRRHLTPLLQA